ncbi:MAG TPA: SMP-30/gluconolactonase/LRE family protein, partial [Acidimicrobiales bacterium]|nr:SMP-30/gluconolactonase/LRE family protein [Acidimicrobiales bacterium]
MKVSTLAEGLGFTEGPTVLSSGEIIAVSIDQKRVYRLGADGVSIAGEPGGGPNGATANDADTIFLAQNGGNWMRNPSPEIKEEGMTGGVQRIHESTVSWVTRDPLAPNDICFGPDGNLYVTDPTRDGKYDDGRIWRCDPETGASE